MPDFAASVPPVPHALALVAHRRQAPELRPQALHLGFLAVLDGILEQKIRLPDLVDQLVSLWHRHTAAIIP